MSTSIVNLSNVNVQQIVNQQVPDDGPKAIPLLLDFTASAQYNLDLTNQQQQGKISMIQSIYVDLSGNASNDLTITMPISGQVIVAKAGTQGYYSVLCPNPPRLNFAMATSGGSVVPVFLLNVPVAGVVWTAP
jgi:hypothetical protein